jgi:hypothetical protein
MPFPTIVPVVSASLPIEIGPIDERFQNDFDPEADPDFDFDFDLEWARSCCTPHPAPRQRMRVTIQAAF